MLCFPCNVLFYMMQQDGYINFDLKHHLKHICYNDISIPEKWCQFIRDNHKLGPMKVCAHCFFEFRITEWGVKIWHEILQQTRGGLGIAFRQKAVCYYWVCKGANVWRCTDDPIDSAHEWCQKFGAQENIEIVEMAHVPHSQAFSFVVKDFIGAWAPKTNSFLVDSMCK